MDTRGFGGFMTGRVLLNRAASILIATALLLTPFTGILLFAGTGGAQALPSEYSNGDRIIGSGYDTPTWEITTETYMNGNLTIKEGGVVVVDHGSLVFSQTLGHDGVVSADDFIYTLTIEDGGKLILKNSTLTTRLNNLNAFPSLGVYVHNGSSLEAYDSTLRFPGHLVVEDSALTLWRSTIEGHDTEDIAQYCNPNPNPASEYIFPTGEFDDAPVMLFVDATVKLYDSYLRDLYEPEKYPDPIPDLTYVYDYNYPFADDQYHLNGSRSAVTYVLDSGTRIIDTYQTVTLAGNTNLTSVNTYIGVDFSPDPYLHNNMVLLDNSKAYVYGLTVDESQDPKDHTREPAFVTVQRTIEILVASSGSYGGFTDNTGEDVNSLSGIDADKYVVNSDEDMVLTAFNTQGLSGSISSAVLHVNYVTADTFNGGSLEWAVDGQSFVNTDITPYGTLAYITNSFNLYEKGLDDLSEIANLNIKFSNQDASSAIRFDRIWIEVTLAPTVYIYRWANVTALDDQGNLAIGAEVSATLVDPYEENAYYVTPDGVQSTPSNDVMRYLGIDPSTFAAWVTGNDGKVTIPYLSEIIDARNPNSYKNPSYNLTVSFTDDSDGKTYYNYVGLPFERYPDLVGTGMFVQLPVYLINLIFLPDLYVAPEDMAFSDATAATEATARITVHNSGAVAATNVVVEIYAGNRATGGQLLSTTTISVPAHSTLEAVLTWIPEEIGNYPIYVYVNPDRTVLESRYTNNIAYKNVTVSIELGGSDLVIGGTSQFQDLTFYPGSTPPSPIANVIVTTGGKLTFVGTQFAMRQSGNAHVIVNGTGQLRLLDGSTMTSTGSIDLVLFDAARLEIVRSTVTADVRILAYDDSEILVDESIVNSELSTVNSNLNAPSTSSMHLAAVNSTFSVVTLANTSTAALTNVSITIFSVQDSAYVEYYRWVQTTVVDGRGAIVEGADVDISRQWMPTPITPIYGMEKHSGTTDSDGRTMLLALSDVITSSPATTRSVGFYWVTVSFEAPDGVTYYGASNDVINVPAYVRGASLTSGVVTPTNADGSERYLALEGWEPELDPANLSVSNLRFTPTGSVQVGATVSILVDITNHGESDSNEAQILLYVDGVAVPTAARPVPGGIGAGDTITVSTTWTASVPLGSRDVLRVITVEVVPGSGDSASDDEEQGTIRVLDSRPDVVFLGNIQVMKSQKAVTNATAGEKVTISATAATSSGSPTAYAMKFYFFVVNETGVRTLIHVTNSMDVKNTDIVALSYTWTINVTTGDYDIEVVANYDGTIDESRTDNNVISTAFEVKTPDPYVTLNIPYGQTYKPGETIFVSGTVTNKNTNAAINGATVSVSLYRNGVIVDNGPFTQKTGSDGNFYIAVHIPEGSEDGTYEIRVTADVNGKTFDQYDQATVKAAAEGGAPWWLYVIILAFVSAVILIFSAYLYKYGLGKMVECGECGALIPDSSKRCPKCGVEFETGTAKCSKCGAWIAANSVSCPDCGAKFITEAVEEEENEYLKSMREQYEAFVDTYREEAKKVLDKKYSDAKFPDWWKKQASYVTFETWLSQEEDKRKIGGVACPTCGILNPRGASICHKCGSPMEAPKAAPVELPPPEEKKPEVVPQQKPLRRIIRRTVEKKPAVPIEAKPEDAPVSDAPKPAEAGEGTSSSKGPKPEEAKAAEEPKPEEDKPSA